MSVRRVSRVIARGWSTCMTLKSYPKPTCTSQRGSLVSFQWYLRTDECELLLLVPLVYTLLTSSTYHPSGFAAWCTAPRSGKQLDVKMNISKHETIYSNGAIGKTRSTPEHGRQLPWLMTGRSQQRQSFDTADGKTRPSRVTASRVQSKATSNSSTCKPCTTSD